VGPAPSSPRPTDPGWPGHPKLSRAARGGRTHVPWIGLAKLLSRPSFAGRCSEPHCSELMGSTVTPQPRNSTRPGTVRVGLRGTASGEVKRFQVSFLLLKCSGEEVLWPWPWSAPPGGAVSTSQVITSELIGAELFRLGRFRTHTPPSRRGLTPAARLRTTDPSRRLILLRSST